MPEWIGKTIGKVRIDRLLAHGGMAEVYLGTHLTLDRPIAVKVLLSYIADDPDLRRRLRREAMIVAGFRHPNIVQVYDFDTIEDHPYIVMEYLNGPTLAGYLKNLHARNARLTAPQVVQLLKGPAAALDYAHGLGVIHRDVKPGNIMLHGATDEAYAGKLPSADFNPVVTDFGLLRVAGATQLNQTSVGTIVGTPNYMSPEQAGGTTTDYRTDIYSLGIVLYEMLGGRAPFDGESTMTVLYKQINEPPPPIRGISAKEQAVIDRALAKNPDDRYQSCAEMIAAYEAAITVPAAEGIYRTPVPPASAAAVPAKEAVTHTTETTIVPKEAARLPRTGWAIPAAIAGTLLLALAIGALFILPKLRSTPGDSSKQATPAQATSDTATSVSVLPASQGMVNVPAGKYQVGMNPADDFHAAPQTVSLAEFWIDLNLVTNDQYQAYVQKTGASVPQVWPGDATHPVRGVSWDQANAYCTWMKKRLPTEAEWEAAGRGNADNPPLYPWGNDPTDGGKALQMPDQDTYEVASQTFNVSILGVNDLVGDVWQWVGDGYAGVAPGLKILRGGRFGLPQDLAYRVAVAPDDNRYVKFAGFRCAADATQ